MTREQLTSYIIETYNASPEHLWAKWPTYAIFRHRNNRKWFAVLMDVPAIKVGVNKYETVDILDIKSDPDLIASLTSTPGYSPAYHMNKQNWITVILDNNNYKSPATEEQIITLLDMSWEMMKK